MIKVYIASRYSIGDKDENVRVSLMAANELINEGFAPFAPLLSHFQHAMFPQGYDTWLALDIEWVSVCDCLLRLPGDSSGADLEVEFARSNSIPVFYTIAQLIEYYTNLADEN